MSKLQDLTLALYPYYKGFGFAVMENHTKPLEYGVIRQKHRFQLQSAVTRIDKLMDFYRPVLILVQDYKFKDTNAAKLISKIVQIAEVKNIKLYQYSRQQIRDVFEVFGATSKYRIAAKIVEAIPELAPRMPRIRKMWENEDYNMPIFNAISLALTHSYLTE